MNALPGKKTRFISAFAVVATAALLVVHFVAESSAEGEKSSSYQVVTVDNGGTVTGVVRFDSKYPKQKRVRVSVNNEACGTHKMSETFLVSPDNKGLKNVLVTIEGISAGKAPKLTTAIELIQDGCQYKPHFQVAEVGPEGVDITFVNNDGIFHNVHTTHSDTTMFNLPQFGEQPEITRKVTDTGVIGIKCDVHKWMGANIVLLENQPYYAVTDEKGQFSIDDVPPGTYTLHAWHEALGTMEKTVEIAGGATADVEFVIKSKGSKKKK